MRAELGLFFIELLLLFIVAAATVLRAMFPDGTMIINRTNPEKDLYRFVVHCPLDKLPKRRYLMVKVRLDDTPYEEDSQNSQIL